MKKILLLSVLMFLSVSHAFEGSSRRGIFLVENPEQHLVVLGGGMLKEANQPGIAYDLTFRCLVPYTEGVFGSVTWLIPDDTLVHVPTIKLRTQLEAAETFLKQKSKRPDICETDYSEIVSDPKSLEELNQLTEHTYMRMAHMMGDKSAKDLQLPADSELRKCLDDLVLVECLNEMKLSCEKK